MNIFVFWISIVTDSLCLRPECLPEKKILAFPLKRIRAIAVSVFGNETIWAFIIRKDSHVLSKMHPNSLCRFYFLSNYLYKKHQWVCECAHVRLSKKFFKKHFSSKPPSCSIARVYWTFWKSFVCVSGGWLSEQSGMLTSEETSNPFTLYLLITLHKFIVPAPMKWKYISLFLGFSYKLQSYLIARNRDVNSFKLQLTGMSHTFR
jgi:hypothetical protein